jgi:hypothetical protein
MSVDSAGNPSSVAQGVGDGARHPRNRPSLISLIEEL